MSNRLFMLLMLCVGFVSTGCNDQVKKIIDDQTSRDVACIDQDGDGYGEGCFLGSDCDDTDPQYAEADSTTTAFIDRDGDGYGNESVPLCAQREELTPLQVLEGGDCDDDDPQVWNRYTGIVDNDGDGYSTDVSGVTCGGEVAPATLLDEVSEIIDCNDNDPDAFQDVKVYADKDGDGSTVAGSKTMCIGTSAPDGYSLTKSSSNDCNDNLATVYPGAPEIPGDFLDNNCSGNSDVLPGNTAGLFVAKWGNNANSGNKNAPLLTIGEAVNRMNNGDKDRVYVAMGQYNESVRPERGGVYGGFATDFSSQDTMATPTTIYTTSTYILHVDVAESADIAGFHLDGNDTSHYLFYAEGDMTVRNIFAPGIGGCGYKNIFYTTRFGSITAYDVMVTDMTDSCTNSHYAVQNGNRVYLEDVRIAYGSGSYSSTYGLYQDDEAASTELNNVSIWFGDGSYCCNYAYGIYANYGEVKLTDVNIGLAAHGRSSYGIYAYGDNERTLSIDVDGLYVHMGTQQQDNYSSYPIYLRDGGPGEHLNLKDVTIVEPDTVAKEGIYIDDWGSVTLDGLIYTSLGGHQYNSRTLRIADIDGDVTVRDVDIQMAGHTSNWWYWTYGIRVQDAGDVLVEDVSLSFGDHTVGAYQSENYFYNLQSLTLNNVDVEFGDMSQTSCCTTQRALYVSNVDGDVVIDDSEFVQGDHVPANSFYQHGGYFQNLYGNLTITDSEFVAASGRRSQALYLDLNNGDEDNVWIQNNEIRHGGSYYDQDYGIYVNDVWGPLTISDNIITPHEAKPYGVGGCGYSHYGIYILDGDDDLRRIEGNTIIGSASWCDFSYGLHLNSGGDYVITNNEIRGGSGRYTRGIYMGCSNTAVIAGNVIHGGYAGVHSSYYGWTRGLEFNDSYCPATIVNNTVYAGEVTYDNSSSFGIYMWSPNLNPKQTVANNIIDFGTMDSNTKYGLYLNTYHSQSLDLHNNIFTGVTGDGASDIYMYDGYGGNYTTESHLNDNCDNFNGCNSASGNLITDPQLVDLPGFDAHIDNAASPAIGAGIPIMTTYRNQSIPTFAQDYDGDARNMSMPDIGADEY